MTTPTPPAPQTVAEREAERRELYGTFVAVVPIDLDGVRAFNPGDAVPSTHVSGGVVREDQVAKTTTKAGRAALGVDDVSKG